MKEMKEIIIIIIKQEYFQRVNRICKKQLHSKNLIKAINTYAIPVLTYSFGIIKWSQTDINRIEIKTRTIIQNIATYTPSRQ